MHTSSSHLERCLAISYRKLRRQWGKYGSGAVLGRSSTIRRKPLKPAKRSWREIQPQVEAWLADHKDQILKMALTRIGTATLSSIGAVVCPEIAAMLGTTTLTQPQITFVKQMIARIFDV